MQRRSSACRSNHSKRDRFAYELTRCSSLVVRDEGIKPNGGHVQRLAPAGDLRADHAEANHACG